MTLVSKRPVTRRTFAMYVRSGAHLRPDGYVKSYEEIAKYDLGGVLLPKTVSRLMDREFPEIAWAKRKGERPPSQQRVSPATPLTTEEQRKQERTAWYAQHPARVRKLKRKRH